MLRESHSWRSPRATVDGTERTLRFDGRLRRPSTCDPDTPTTTSAPASTTQPATTTTQVPAPPTITDTIANPNPVPCGDAVTIGAQTSGAVDSVGARLGAHQTALVRNGGSWRADVTAPGGPGDYVITFVARNSTTGETDTRKVMLRVGC